MKIIESSISIPNKETEKGPAKILVIGSLNMDLAVEVDHRSEERRVGKECM